MASSTPADDQLAASEVIFTLPRLPRGRRVRLALGGAAGSSVVALIVGLLAPGDWAVSVAFGAAAVGSAVLDLRRRRFRTRLSAQGVEVRGYVDRFIPWSEVTGIEVGGYPMPDAGKAPIRGTPGDSPVKQRLATVRVARRRGRSVLLRAPLVTSRQHDPEFENKVRLLRQWWRDYGQGPT